MVEFDKPYVGAKMPSENEVAKDVDQKLDYLFSSIHWANSRVEELHKRLSPVLNGNLQDEVKEEMSPPECDLSVHLVEAINKIKDIESQLAHILYRLEI